MPKHLSGAGLAIGLGLVVAGIVIGFDTARMQVPPAYARVGPQVFPFLIAIGIAATGAALAWQSLRPKPAAETEATDWTAVAVIAGGLAAHLNLLKPAGFVPAAIVLFMCVAFAAYLGFSYGLKLQLPPGILKGII